MTPSPTSRCWQRADTFWGTVGACVSPEPPPPEPVAKTRLSKANAAPDTAGLSDTFTVSESPAGLDRVAHRRDALPRRGRREARLRAPDRRRRARLQLLEHEAHGLPRERALHLAVEGVGGTPATALVTGLDVVYA